MYDPAQIRTVENDCSFYKPLHSTRKEIRALVIHGGTEDDELCCGLVHLSLATAPLPVFNCLSYCWGDLRNYRTMKLYQIEDFDFGISPSSSEGVDDWLSQHTAKYKFLKTERPHKIVYQDFNITTSLDGALKRIRKAPGEYQSLWVDAVCINQSDVLERGQQVRDMKDLYSIAKEVFVWLGDYRKNEPADITIQGMQSLVDQFEKEWGVPVSAYIGPDGHHHVPPARTASFVRYEPLPDLDSKNENPLVVKARIRNALVDFTNKPWFNRLWVVQEVSRARKATVLWGPYCSPWSDVVATMHWLETTRTFWAHQKLNSCHRLWLITSRAGLELSLADLLMWLGSWATTDPRDKIYALLGIARDTKSRDVLPETLRPDYSKTTKTVYQEAIHWIIDSTGSTAILAAVELFPHRRDALKNGEEGREEWPSWLPCFQDSHLSTSSHWSSFSFDCTYKAAGASCARLGESHHADILSLEGYQVDQVQTLIPLSEISAFEEAEGASKCQFCHKPRARTSGLAESRNEYAHPATSKGVQLLQSIMDIVQKRADLEDAPHQLQTTAKSEFLEAVTKTLTSCGNFNTEELALGFSPFQSDNHFAAQCKYCAEVPSEVCEVQDSLSSRGMWHRIEHTLLPRALGDLKRQFVFTESGFFGICPQGTRVGDAVCIFNGGPAFYVLREHVPRAGPQRAPSPLYEYIGECYLHSLMDGIVLDELLSKFTPSYMFHLF